MSNLVHNIQEILNPASEEYTYLSTLVDDIRRARNITEINTAFDGIKRFLSRTFAINCSMTLLNTVNDTHFFGINIFPDTDTCRKIIDIILDSDNRRLDDVKNIWRENANWHIDIDGKLFKDLSHPFTANDFITILIYKLDRICFSQDIITQIYLSIRGALLTLPYVTNQIVRSNICRNIYIIPFIRGCSYTDFITELPEESLLFGSDAYQKLLHQLVSYYGTTNLIDRNPKDFIHEMHYNILWIFEALNDLKYTLRLFKKTIMEQVIIEKSVYVKNILISIYKIFATYDDIHFETESAVPKYPTVSPKKKELEDSIVANKIINKLEAVREDSRFDFIDRHGKAEKITQEDIDMLKVEADSIASNDDKLYYLGRCHKLLNIVDNALSMLKDKELAKKVTTPPKVLEKQKEQLEGLRARIISAPLAVRRYGLFLDYPTNYRG